MVKEFKLPKVMSHEEVLLLFQKAKNSRDKVLLETIYYMGLRVSEAINLSLEDLDLKGGYAKVLGKGRKERTVPIPKPLKIDLEAWIKLQNLAKGKLFRSSKGDKPITRQTASNIIKKLNPQIHIHTLRHSYATYVLEKTGDIEMVKELLGHSNIKTTQIYTHLRKEHKKAITDKVFE